MDHWVARFKVLFSFDVLDSTHLPQWKWREIEFQSINHRMSAKFSEKGINDEARDGEKSEAAATSTEPVSPHQEGQDHGHRVAIFQRAKRFVGSVSSGWDGSSAQE